MASDIMARIATASVISISVKPLRRIGLTTQAINIKLEMQRLSHASARPLHGQSDQANAGKLEIVFFQSSRDSFLDQLHWTISGIDFCFRGRIREAGGRLYLRHSIGQNQADPFILGVERARIQTILHTSPKRKNANRENRNP